MTVTRKGHNPTYCNLVFRARPVPKFRPLFFQQKKRKTEKMNHDQSFRKVLGNYYSNETTPFFLINTIKNRGLSIAMLPYAGSCSQPSGVNKSCSWTPAAPISHLQSIASQMPRFDTQHEADGIHKVWFPSSIRTLASTHLLVLLCFLGSSKICWYLLILLGFLSRQKKHNDNDNKQQTTTKGHWSKPTLQPLGSPNPPHRWTFWRDPRVLASLGALRISWSVNKGTGSVSFHKYLSESKKNCWKIYCICCIHIQCIYIYIYSYMRVSQDLGAIQLLSILWGTTPFVWLEVFQDDLFDLEEISHNK